MAYIILYVPILCVPSLTSWIMVVSLFQGVVEVQNLSKIRSFRWLLKTYMHWSIEILPNIMKPEVNYTYKVWWLNSFWQAQTKIIMSLSWKHCT